MPGPVGGSLKTDTATIQAVPNTLPHVLAERSWILASYSAVLLLGRSSSLGVNRIAAWSPPSRSSESAPGSRFSQRSDVRRRTGLRLEPSPGRLSLLSSIERPLRDLRLPSAATPGHHKFQDAETSNVARCLGAKTLPSSPNGARAINFFEERAALERDGRNNLASCSEKINRLYSQFERVPSHTIFL
jgi:hypothetical protein